MEIPNKSHKYKYARAKRSGKRGVGDVERGLRRDPDRPSRFRRQLEFDEGEEPEYGIDTGGDNDGPGGIAGPPFPRGVSAIRHLAQLRCTPEKGYVDYDFLDDATLGGGFICQSLNFVNQGSALNERIGDSIRVREIFIRARIQRPGHQEWLGTITPVQISPTACMQTRVRVLVVQDKQSRLGVPSPNDVLQSNFATSKINAFRNLAMQQRFNVLDDQTITLPERQLVQWGFFVTPDTWQATYVPHQMVDYYAHIKCDITSEQINDGSTSYSGVSNNNIFIIAWTDYDPIDSLFLDVVYVNGVSRCRFYA